MRAAEAEIYLRRVRAHRLLSQALSDPYYDDREDVRKIVAVLGHLLVDNAPESADCGAGKVSDQDAGGRMSR